MKRCNKCGRNLSNDSEFCSYCGSQDLSKILRISMTCKTCGQELPYDSTFCQYCGNDALYKKVIVEDNSQYVHEEQTYTVNKSPVNKIVIVVASLIVLIAILICLISTTLYKNNSYGSFSTGSNLTVEERKLIEEANSKHK